MTQTIRFSSVDGDRTIGTATRTDDGEIAPDEAVAGIMAPMRARVGDDKAWDWFSNWGNQGTRSRLVETEPDAEAATSPLS